jgi:iron complex outermembrane receptor protein
MVDLSATYASSGDKYEVISGCTNVTDKRYVVTGQNQFAGGQVNVQFNEPREWYLRLRARF